jgi:hypothetical protein
LVKRFIQSIIVITIFFLAISCAKIGRPSGGPKDTKSPQVLFCEPQNMNTNYNRDHFEIFFDEYVTLRNIKQELIVSPPLSQDPEVINKGKSIKVNLYSNLKTNTTYTFSFGDAIVDYREANPLKNYRYVLSTGDYIDSLSVFGQVLNAFNLKPPSDKVWVILHDTLQDSVLYNNQPSYITQTDKEGYFSMLHIKNDSFKIFALNDINANYQYDMPNEKIAFTDTILLLNQAFFYEKVSEAFPVDSIKTDTNLTHTAQKDTVKVDELTTYTTSFDTIYGRKFLNKTKPLDLLLFKEEIPQKQYLKDYKREAANKFIFVFNKSLKQAMKCDLLDPAASSSTMWFVKEINPTRDSIIYWITDSAILKKETVKAELSYVSKDSSRNDYLANDTVLLSYSPFKKNNRDKNAGDTNKKTLDLVISVSDNGQLDLNKYITIEALNPVKYSDTSHIILLKQKDTSFVNVSFLLNRKQVAGVDTFEHLRLFKMKNNWVEGNNYKLKLFPGAFKDIYGLTNDTIEVTFTTRENDYYGLVKINVKEQKMPLIFQLLNEKETELVKEHWIEGAGNIVFDYLHPGKYRLKVINDRNGNKKWDTGDYSRKKQPEKVRYHQGTIEVKSNWEMELEF